MQNSAISTSRQSAATWNYARATRRPRRPANSWGDSNWRRALMKALDRNPAMARVSAAQRWGQSRLLPNIE